MVPATAESPDQKSQLTWFGSQKKKEVYGAMKGKMPMARDGHTSMLIGDQMIIFGGDRHRMPFSDTYALNVKSQLVGKNIN